MITANNHVFKAKLVNESVIKREGSNDRVPVKSSQSTYKTYPTHQLQMNTEQNQPLAKESVLKEDALPK